MKKIILLLVLGIFALVSTGSTSNKHLPFAGKTKHKTVKYMKKKHVKKAQKGKNYYFRKNGKIKKRR